jgi:hypothetical protein
MVMMYHIGNINEEQDIKYINMQMENKWMKYYTLLTSNTCRGQDGSKHGGLFTLPLNV